MIQQYILESLKDVFIANDIDIAIIISNSDIEYTLNILTSPDRDTPLILKINNLNLNGQISICSNNQDNKLIFSGNNTIRSFTNTDNTTEKYYSAINIPENSKLNIIGDNKDSLLSCYGHGNLCYSSGSSGIGSNSDENCGVIQLSGSGLVKAIGGVASAGIGGGSNGLVNKI